MVFLSRSCRRGALRILALVAIGGLGVSLRAEFYLYTPTAENPVFPRQYAPGSSVTFTLQVPDTSGTFQWFHDDVAIPGAISSTLVLSNLTSADTGNYFLQHTVNGAVENSETRTVNVLAFPASPVDPTFSSDLPRNYGRVLFVYPDDSSLVQSSEGPTTFRLSRLLPNGHRDPAFDFPAGPIAPVNLVLAILPDGGFITSTAPYRYLANGTARPLTLPVALGATLTAAIAQPDGKLILAENSHAVRLNPDDSVDSTFNYSSGLSPQHTVLGLQLDAGGKVYVSAREVDSVPGHYPQFFPVIVRLFGTGNRDAYFVTQFAPLNRGEVRVFPLSDGRVFRFASYEGIPSWSVLGDDGVATIPFTSTAVPLSTYPTFAVDPVRMKLFSVDSNNVMRRYTITALGLIAEPGFYQGSGVAQYIAFTSTGQLLVSGNFSAWDGFATAGVVRLRATDNVAIFSPSIAGPVTMSPVLGSTVTFNASVTGTGPFTYQWLALDHQPLPADTTSPQLVLANVSGANLGRYQLRVTVAGGSILSRVAELYVGTAYYQLPYLANLSGRAFVGTGDNTAIAGLAVKRTSGALGVTALLRGAGPALRDYGIGGYLPNPTINLYSDLGTLLANNDTWGGTAGLRDAMSATGAFPFAADSNDAALLQSFDTGNTTLQLTDIGGASGVGLVEVYRVSPTTLPAEFLNLSLRARTAPGEQVATAGFVINDPLMFGRSARVLLRVVGPTLSDYGVAAPLPDPVLTVYNSHGAVVATNDNWSSTDVAATAQQVGAFDLPVGSKDAALALDLPAGAYSIQATGAPGTANAGVVLIEIYLVR